MRPLVGEPVQRIEDLRLLRGKGGYVDDLARDGMLHAAILRSGVAHGRLNAIDASAALKLSGVVAVLTAAEIGQPTPRIPMRLAPIPQLEPYAQPVIADGKVRYVGEPIAVVIAHSASIAEDALDLIRVEIDPLPVADGTSSIAGAAALFDGCENNCPIVYETRKGDAYAEFPDAYVLREKFYVQRHTAVCMEPRGVLAEWDAAAGHLTVLGAAKVPFSSRGILAKQLGMPDESIDLIEGDVGGGFGVRGEFYPEDFLIPFAARYLDRSVKWIEDRRENLLSSNHARDMGCELELVCSRDGLILALRGRAFNHVGAYLRANVAIAPRNVGQFLSGPYRIPNISIDAEVILGNKTPSGTYRGPGRFEGDFFRERLFDLAAQGLGIDRLEFRRLNLVASHEMPYSLATVSPPVKEEELDSGDYHMTFDRCLHEFDWKTKSKLQGQLINGRYHGLGVGCFIEGGAAGPRETARVEMKSDGYIDIYVGSTSVGQGLETVCLQIAADALELPMDRLRIFHGSTNLLPEGFGSFHSRSTVMGGTAIMLASARLKEEFRNAVARRFNCAPDEAVIVDWVARAPDGRVLTMADVASENLTADGVFSNHKHTYAYGAHAAHVAVDAQTGQVEILDYVAIEDVGRIINPLTLQGQAIGAIVQGLGGVFLENLVYDDDGQLLTGSLADYLMPTATDFPNLRAIMLGCYTSDISPLGAKGGGEGGVIPVGGVIANAIASALKSLNVEPKRLPLSPSDLWELIQKSRAD